MPFLGRGGCAYGGHVEVWSICTSVAFGQVDVDEMVLVDFASRSSRHVLQFSQEKIDRLPETVVHNPEANALHPYYRQKKRERLTGKFWSR